MPILSVADTLTLTLIVLFTLLGFVLGSALNCLAYRMVHHIPWSRGNSRCPKCKHVLKGTDLIPLLSFLFLRGKCRYCNEKISPRYLVCECFLAIVFPSLFLRFELSLTLLSTLILVSCLFTLSLIDLDTQLIPDRFLIIPAVVQIVLVLTQGGLYALWQALVPALILGGFVLLLTLLMDKVLHKDTMGGGDIKLLFVLGLFFSLGECLLLLIFSCIIGIAFALVTQKAKPDTPFAFGPALSLGAILTLFVGEPIVYAYTSLFF